MRVLVTGATGLIGRHAVSALAAAGVEVHAVARRPRAVHLPPGVRLHEADLVAGPSPRELVGRVRPTHLLHLAWTTEHQRYWSDPANLDWVAATLLLARAFAESGGTRLVGCGTCAEYDWTDPIVETADCLEGTTPIRPRSLYGSAKDSCRQLLAAYSAERGLGFAWGRVFFPFGAGEDSRRFFPSTIAALRAGRPAICLAGSQLRDFLAAEDVGAAFASLVLSEADGAVNVASGNPRSILDAALTIGRLLGRPELVVDDQSPRPGEPQRLVADVRRLRDEVRFSPAADFEQRVSELIAAA